MKGVSKTVKYKAKEQTDGYLCMFVDTLGVVCFTAT